MTFSQEYKFLSTLYNPDLQKMDIPGYGMTIYNVPFHSINYPFLPKDSLLENKFQTDYHLYPDSAIKENQVFNYPVFLNNDNHKTGKVIILLHGLNERTWDKYLPWATALLSRTKHPVILFPISFHINRGPTDWNNPKLMNALSMERKKENSQLTDSTYVNAAISSRMQEIPSRFYFSGLETYFDMVSLIKQLNEGTHPLIKEKCEVEFFSYSIGALLTEIVLMTNPDNRLKNTKAVLFCGGSTFDMMNGTSRYILDSAAVKTLRYYFSNLDFMASIDEKLQSFFKNLKAGVYFRSMMNSNILNKIRSTRLHDLKNQFLALALHKDTVIPAKAINETFSQFPNEKASNVKVFDFPYEYTHENPFPINKKDIEEAVTTAFNQIFDLAAMYLI